ncbi:unnamed protein product [Linum tenue]|uniref:ARC105/Med15 mediator subunit C-terminal domain-containing protein n=1 Tax=Linum tenue TaxID=586396 RepID=A0AAV0PTC6_9ROSI|nr:unnamed protein product [Linum tenue]
MARREEKHDEMSSGLLDQFYAQYNTSTNHNTQNRTRQQQQSPPPPPPQPALQPHGMPSSMAFNWQLESLLKQKMLGTHISRSHRVFQIQDMKNQYSLQLLEKSGKVAHHAFAATVSGRKVTEQPFRHLVNLVQLISREALSAAVEEIWSIVSLSDLAPGEMRMNHWGDVVSSSSFDTSISNARIEINPALQEEVRGINQRLVETKVAIILDGNARTIMKCSFNAVSISPMQPIEPLKLLVPANYPHSSPVFLETMPVDIGGEDDLSVKAKSRLNRCLRSLLHPLTLEDIVQNWDVCARQVITEYALKKGGGSFSSQYGTWETV